MATQSLPSTPKATRPTAEPSGSSGTPGKWRHPQLNEIVRRQNAATFGDKNLKKVLWNGAALIVSWMFGNTFKSYTRRIFDNNTFYNQLPLLLVQLFFALNIFLAVSPLFRPKDNFNDIPLTPTQRQLLGLDPSEASSATPDTAYVTPPRYRLSTSRKASPASANRQSSPMSTTPSLSDRRTPSNFSPITSPLFHTAVPGRESVRRPSFSSSMSSYLGRSNSFTESGMSSIGPSTPSPLAGKSRASLGVNNRWLYEKSRSRRLSASNGPL